MKPVHPFLKLEAGQRASLAEGSRFPAAGHLWSQPEIDALILAQACRRPLLVRGEAGCGKSQVARAAAQALGGTEPLVEVIHPRFEALDLLYRFDTLARLADAQIGKLDSSNRKYVRRGRLWEAYEQSTLSGAGAAQPVLLIDEIDKADADIPNALLEVLGNRSFTVSPLNNRAIQGHPERFPLIVITTNEERELPPAFIRRCVVLNLKPPETDGKPEADRKFMDWLVKRGQVHEHLQIESVSRQEAAKLVLADRKEAIANGYPRVGLSEYIDLLTALHELTHEESDADARAAAQIDWLRRLSAYALMKSADQTQFSEPESPPGGEAQAAG
ncbi:MAG: MoxR family ATPase [Gammaproteobacteria bacterium]|nr:MoxR family ATPase [Gammaproteobacteria bacterium]